MRLSLPSDATLLGLLAVALLVLRAAISLSAGLDLHFDEAQYWEWSRRPDWSYYSKGPMVAWLIALSTGLFGHGEWQVRLPAWLAYDAFMVLLYLTARDLWQSRTAGWWAVLLGLTTPLYFVLGQVMTTDVLLFLFWTWALWAAYRAVHRQRTGAWYELGAAVGLGALTKMSIGLLPFFLGLLLLLKPDRRRLLASVHPWLAIVLMLCLMSPLLLWNAGHDWVMFRHEQGHIAGTGADQGHLWEFLAGQWLALSPLVVLFMAWRLARPPAQAGHRLLWQVSLAVLAFFLFKAGFSKVQLNWPAPTYIGLLLVFAGHLPTARGWQRGGVLTGLVLSLAIIWLALFPASLGVPAERDPFKRLKLWQGPLAALAAQAGRTDFLLTPEYHLAGELAFYWPRPITVYLTGGTGRRFNQYDLWPGPEREAGRDGLFVSTSNALPGELRAAFDRCRRLEPTPAVADNGQVLRSLFAWSCFNYRPVLWPAPRSY